MNEVLTQTEAIADEKANFSRELQLKIGENLVSLRGKCERIERQIAQINEYLTTEKKGVEDEVAKAKSIMIRCVNLQKRRGTRIKIAK